MTNGAENVLITDQIINLIFSPIGAIVFILFVMIVGLAIIYDKFNLSKVFTDKAFKGIPIETILKNRCNSLIKVVKIKGDWGSLQKEDTRIAKILSAGKIYYTHEIKEKKDSKDKGSKKKPKTKIEEKELYIFKLSFNPNIPVLRSVMDATINAPRYAIIPAEFITRFDMDKNNKVKTHFNISANASVFSFGKIYVYGLYALNTARNMAWNYGREKETEELVNYAKRIVFLEARHSKKVETLDELAQLEKKKFNDRLGNL